MIAMAIMALALAVLMVVNAVTPAVRVSPSNGIIAHGTPRRTGDFKVETATNVYPGRLVKMGSAEGQIVVATALGPHLGVAGFEKTQPGYQPTNVNTVYTANDIIAVHGGGCDMNLSLASGFYANIGDELVRWDNGQVAVGAVADGGVTIRIPWTYNSNVETDTTVDLPTDVFVLDAYIDVTTVDATETIDVGLDEAVVATGGEVGGDANGFIAGASIATAVRVRPTVTVTTGSNEVYFASSTLGALLVDTFTAGTDNATDVGTFARQAHRIDGTAKSVTYTCSAGSDTGVGNIYLVLGGMELQVVGRALQTVDATSAAADIVAEVY